MSDFVRPKVAISRVRIIRDGRTAVVRFIDSEGNKRGAMYFDVCPKSWSGKRIVDEAFKAYNGGPECWHSLLVKGWDLKYSVERVAVSS